MSESVRVVLISGFCIFRSGLRLLIESEPERIVVGEATNIEEAVGVVAAQRPQIVILDVCDGVGQATEGISRLHSVSEETKVVVISSGADVRGRHLAVKNGALGIVSKKSTPEVFFKALEKVNKGEAWIDRSTMANVLTEMLRPRNSNGEQPEKKMCSLTQRERQIVNEVARGLSNKQIGAHLSISEVTVRHHLTSIFGKLEVADRYELTIYALKNSIEGIGDSV